MRRFMVPLLGSLLFATPARAEVIQLRTSEVPRAGHVEVLTFGSYTAYGLKIIGGKTYAANPVGTGYHWADVWTSVEAGVLSGVSLQVQLPYAMARAFEATSSITGPGDLELLVARRLHQDEDSAWKLAFAYRHPTGGPGLGIGVPAVGFETSYRRELWRDRLDATLNLTYRSQLRSTRDEAETRLPVTHWLGDRWSGGVGLAWRATSQLTAVLEVLGQVSRAHELERQAVANTGSAWLMLAPGLGFQLSPALELQASAVIPAWRGGFQDSFDLAGMAGARVRL